MKKENRIRLLCTVLLIGGGLYHFSHPAASFFFLILPPLLLMASLIPVRKRRTPDYSGLLSISGIFLALALLSYVFYDAEFFGVQQSRSAEIVCALVFLSYYLFLTWYKNPYSS